MPSRGHQLIYGIDNSSQLHSQAQAISEEGEDAGHRGTGVVVTATCEDDLNNGWNYAYGVG